MELASAIPEAVEAYILRYGTQVSELLASVREVTTNNRMEIQDPSGHRGTESS